MERYVLPTPVLSAQRRSIFFADPQFQRIYFIGSMRKSNRYVAKLILFGGVYYVYAFKFNPGCGISLLVCRSEPDFGRAVCNIKRSSKSSKTASHQAMTS